MHIGDRESDIYELFCLAHDKKTHFLVRTCVDRLAGAGNTTIARKMKRVPIQGTLHVEVLDAKRHTTQVKLQLRYSQMTVRPPIGKHKNVSTTFINSDSCVGEHETNRTQADLLEATNRHTGSYFGYVG